MLARLSSTPANAWWINPLLPVPLPNVDSNLYNGTAMMRSSRPSEPSRWEVVHEWASPRLIPTILILLGLAIAVWGAYLTPQPPPGQLAFLQLLASAFNILGAVQFARIGKADPKHARSAVRRLYTVGVSLTVASEGLKSALETQDRQKTAECVQVILSQVEAAQRHLIDAVTDWEDVHPQALREVRRAQRDEEEARGERNSA